MTRPRILILAILSIVLLLAGSTVAMAATHSDVNLKNAAGANVKVDGTEAYSPKASCGGCHINNCILNNTRPTNTMKWCETETDKANLGNKTDDYGSGTAYSTHVQGVLDSNNQVYWQAYQNKSFEHGVSVGRHMNEGRNEAYSNANRAAVGDPFFTSSLGMFGKF